MKQVSNQFIETQDRIIRPATKLYFEVNTDITEIANCKDFAPYQLFGFDHNVAPVTSQLNCSNESYYAVVGADVPVGDPNRICAPYRVIGQFPTPDRPVPVGVCNYAEAGEEVFVGCDDNFAQNFYVGFEPITISFVGDYIPKYITIEFYDINDNHWYSLDEIENPTLNKEITYEPISHDFWSVFVRFRFRNDTSGGRYQLNWVRMNRRNPISFVDNIITSVNISEETDLTSQSFPSYEMTVECIDANGLYAPSSNNWAKFAEGTPCYFKAGFELGGITEYVSLFYGKLTQEPDYVSGKVKFKLAFDFGKLSDEMSPSRNGANLNVGDLALDDLFRQFNAYSQGFDVTDIFVDSDDGNNSKTNYYGKVEDARKLIANALGGYITADLNRVLLYNTGKIQYKLPVDYLTRLEQIQCSLENQSKVRTISVVRNENRVSEDHLEVTFDEITMVAGEYLRVYAIIPFYGYAKIVLENSTIPSGVSLNADGEKLLEDGTTKVDLFFYNGSEASVTFTPKATYYKVENTKFTETETLDANAGETYTNDNDLVTNSYIAEKVKRVARLISGMTEQYEIDVVQDFRYEIGDVIRVETERNVFRTCVITGLKFTLPGSKGRVSCRKTFALENLKQAITDAVGAIYFLNSSYVRVGTLTVLVTENGTTIGGAFVDNVNSKTILIVIGGTRYKYTDRIGTETEQSPNIAITDKNKHVWYARSMEYSSTSSTAGYEQKILTLPNYENTTGIDNALAYGAINLIKAAYEAQGMIAPVDYNCEYEILS